MTKVTIPLSIILLIPCLITILNYTLGIELLDKIFMFVGLNTNGSHLSLGAWTLLAYIVLLPVIQFFIFLFSKSSFGVGTKGKITIFLVTALTSITAWHICMEDIILMKLS